jgi:hypothetical protein
MVFKQEIECLQFDNFSNKYTIQTYLQGVSARFLGTRFTNAIYCFEPGPQEHFLLKHPVVYSHSGNQYPIYIRSGIFSWQEQNPSMDWPRLLGSLGVKYLYPLTQPTLHTSEELDYRYRPSFPVELGFQQPLTQPSYSCNLSIYGPAFVLL